MGVCVPQGESSAVGRQGVNARRRAGARRAQLPEVRQKARQRLEVRLQGRPSGGAQLVSALRFSPLEALGADDVAGFLELARLNRQVPIGGLQQVAHLREAELLRYDERREDAEPEPL